MLITKASTEHRNKRTYMSQLSGHKFITIENRFRFAVGCYFSWKCL